MHFQSLITIIALLALTPTLIFAQNATLNAPLNFNCSTFTAPPGGPANLNTTAPSNQTIRVSRAVICAANAASNDPSCSISAGGLVNITATSNATDIPDARVLHAMLARYLNSSGAFSPFDTFIKNQRFNASGTPTRVPPGKAAYVGFTANMTCYDGIVSTPDSCDSSDQGIRNVKEKFENRPLRICVPVHFRTGPAKRRRTRIRGNTALVEVSEQEAKREDMQRNPAAQESSADDDEEEEDDQARPRPSSSVLPGGSARMDVKWSAGVGIGVALWMVGFM